MCLSEPLGPQQSAGEIDQEPRGHEAGERIVEDHDGPLTACRRRRRSRSTVRKSRVRWPPSGYPAWSVLPGHGPGPAMPFQPNSMKCIGCGARLRIDGCQSHRGYRLAGTAGRRISRGNTRPRYMNLIEMAQLSPQSPLHCSPPQACERLCWPASAAGGFRADGH